MMVSPVRWSLQAAGSSGNICLLPRSYSTFLFYGRKQHIYLFAEINLSPNKVHIIFQYIFQCISYKWSMERK